MNEFEINEHGQEDADGWTEQLYEWLWAWLQQAIENEKKRHFGFAKKRLRKRPPFDGLSFFYHSHLTRDGSW